MSSQHSYHLRNLRLVPPEPIRVTETSPAGAKPRDCDFLKAPLGSKGCHYEKVKNSSTGITAKDLSTGQMLMSEDYGKTWYTSGISQVFPTHLRRYTITLYVDYQWEKIQD